tara:strand:+ start:127 stop:519 length:393 start_codon:yes stop_codon:yes gene_type:complete
MTLSDDLSVTICDCAFAQALLPVKHVDVGMDSPSVILGLLTEEFDTLVYFDVLLATNVRGLEFVSRHLIEFVVDKGKSFIDRMQLLMQTFLHFIPTIGKVFDSSVDGLNLSSDAAYRRVKHNTRYQPVLA